MQQFKVTLTGLAGRSRTPCPYFKNINIGSYSCVNCNFCESETTETIQPTKTIATIKCRCLDQISKVKNKTGCKNKDVEINSLFLPGGTLTDLKNL